MHSRKRLSNQRKSTRKSLQKCTKICLADSDWDTRTSLCFNNQNLVRNINSNQGVSSNLGNLRSPISLDSFWSWHINYKYRQGINSRNKFFVLHLGASGYLWQGSYCFWCLKLQRYPKRHSPFSKKTLQSLVR